MENYSLLSVFVILLVLFVTFELQGKEMNLTSTNFI